MRPNFNGRKTRLVYAGVGAIALAIPATAAALTVGPFSPSARGGNAPRSGDVKAVVAAVAPPQARVARERAVRTAAQRDCVKLFTVSMGKRAADRIYSRTKPVTRHDLRELGRIERCQRNPAAERFVREYDRRHAHRHAARVAAAKAAAQAPRSRQPHRSTEAQGQPSQSQTQPQPTASEVAISGLEACIIERESGGDPEATNGQYEGLGQWSPAAWAEDGGTQYAPTPLGASAAEQEAVLSSEGAAGMEQQQGQYDGC
jgi:hypothetical protein